MTTTTTTTEKDWPTTMRAWIYDGSGGPIEKTMSLKESTPAPPKTLLASDSVLVKVLYMSLNPADYKIAEMGKLARVILSPPASPGMDYSGRVVLTGSSSSPYRPGQLVFGRIDPTKYGTLAEYIIVKNNDGLVAVSEDEEDDENETTREMLPQLAGVGTGALTSLQAIKPYIGAGGPETKVFINGGSGGTGTFAIQIAKALGCHVTTSCSARNADFCRSLGADEIIDYQTQPIGEVLASGGPVFQLVVDNVGISPRGQVDLYTAANSFLKDDGWFIQVGGGASAEMLKATLKRALLPGMFGGGKRQWKMIKTAQSHADLVTIFEWIKEGKVKVPIDEVFDFNKAPEAYIKLKTGRTKGKIVIKVQE